MERQTDCSLQGVGYTICVLQQEVWGWGGNEGKVAWQGLFDIEYISIGL